MKSCALSTRNFALLSLFLGLGLTACSGVETEKTYSDKAREKTYEYGSVVSDDGGFSLFDGDKDKPSEATGIGVNGFLWRASLDTIAFMPIASVDPFGGVITTDWYSAPNLPDERSKINVFILDRELRADGVRVSIFRQTKAADGQWADAPVSPTTASQLEETILTRARQLRLAQKQ